MKSRISVREKIIKHNPGIKVMNHIYILFLIMKIEVMTKNAAPYII